MFVPIILVLGSGPNIGNNVARAFAAKGYKVAMAARSMRDGIDENGYLRLHIDLSKPESVPEVFDKVKEKLGTPSVVVYNGASRSVEDAIDPLSSLSLADINHDMAVNITSTLVAAQQAVLGFKTLPTAASRTFIFTGNKLNVMPLPRVLCFGMGKSAIAHLVQAASLAYEAQGFKFYYTDERLKDGTHAGAGIDGPASGNLYVKLSEQETQGPWHYTFVKDVGYVNFHL